MRQLKRPKHGTKVRISNKVLIIGGRLATVDTRKRVEDGRVRLHVPLARGEFFRNRPVSWNVALQMVKVVK